VTRVLSRTLLIAPLPAIYRRYPGGARTRSIAKRVTPDGSGHSTGRVGTLKTRTAPGLHLAKRLTARRSASPI